MRHLITAFTLCVLALTPSASAQSNWRAEDLQLYCSSEGGFGQTFGAPLPEDPGVEVATQQLWVLRSTPDGYPPFFVVHTWADRSTREIARVSAVAGFQHVAQSRGAFSRLKSALIASGRFAAFDAPSPTIAHFYAQERSARQGLVITLIWDYQITMICSDGARDPQAYTLPG